MGVIQNAVNQGISGVMGLTDTQRDNPIAKMKLSQDKLEIKKLAIKKSIAQLQNRRLKIESKLKGEL